MDRVGWLKGAPVQQRLVRLGWGSPVEGRSGRKDEVVTKTVEMAFKACAAGRRGSARGGRGGRGQAQARRGGGGGTGGAVRGAELDRSGDRRSCPWC